MIKSYVPPKIKIIDFRKPEGGYYVASCDVCGTEFYPKRSNAKYCSDKCSTVHYRKGVVDGTIAKKPVAILKKGGAIQKKPKKVQVKIEKPIDYSKASLSELKEVINSLKIVGEEAPKQLMDAFKAKYLESCKDKKK